MPVSIARTSDTARLWTGSEGRGYGRDDMKRLFLLSVVPFLACHHGNLRPEEAPDQEQENPSPETPDDRIAETVVGPVSTEWTGTPGDGFNAALRGAVGLGFEVSFSNSSAGVFTAERTALDRATTTKLERDRQEAWNRLSMRQQELASRRGSTLTQSVIVSRKLILSVAAGPAEVIVTPRVEVCIQQGQDVRCVRRDSLQPDEIEIVQEFVGFVSASAPKQPAPLTSEAAVQEI